MRAIGTLMMMRAWRKRKTTGLLYSVGSFLYHIGSHSPTRQAVLWRVRWKESAPAASGDTATGSDRKVARKN